MLSFKSDTISFIKGFSLASLTKLLMDTGIKEQDVINIKYEMIISAIHIISYIFGAVAAGLLMIFINRWFKNYFKKIDEEIENIKKNEQ